MAVSTLNPLILVLLCFLNDPAPFFDSQWFFDSLWWALKNLGSHFFGANKRSSCQMMDTVRQAEHLPIEDYCRRQGSNAVLQEGFWDHNEETWNA